MELKHCFIHKYFSLNHIPPISLEDLNMTFISRWIHKSQRWLTILFGGLVVTGTLYLILKPLPPPAPQPKPKTQQELDAIDNWTKKDLFSYLSNHQVYPDVETSRSELVRLVKSLMRLYPDIDRAA